MTQFNQSDSFYFQIVNQLYKLGWLASQELEDFVTHSETDCKGPIQVSLFSRSLHYVEKSVLCTRRQCLLLKYRWLIFAMHALARNDIAFGFSIHLSYCLSKKQLYSHLNLFV